MEDEASTQYLEGFVPAGPIPTKMGILVALQMLGQVARLSERLATYLTTERLLAGMDPQVLG